MSLTKSFLLLLGVIPALAATAQSGTIVSTDAYRWTGDSIIQGEYHATAPSATEIVSTYHAQPGYRMPVDARWTLKNDISQYPSLSTPNTLHQAIYNMGLDEMVNAVEPDTTLRTGREWAGVWTRDVSYSILLSMAYMQPLATEVSLRKKVSPTGRIIQDTGSGGAWPVSSDRMIWAVAAYELYKVTGDRNWLEYIYPVIKNSIEDDILTVYTPGGLVKGETSFIDWREQSYPKWMQTKDIYNSESLSTSAVHAQALKVLSEIASELGHKAEAEKYSALSSKIAAAINDRLWMNDKGYYAMYTYGIEHPILNPRAESLGEALTILYDIAPADRARAITANYPTTPFGVPVFWPQIADMPPYHNKALWPWVASYWGLANAKAGNEQGVLEAFGSVFRPAALFATNKENLDIRNGDIATELNSSNMLWCLAGNIALTHRILFGIHYEKDRLAFQPFVPKALGTERTLSNFPYRKATLNITVRGYGNRIKSFTVNGKETEPYIPANASGVKNIVITMADNDIAPASVNHTPSIDAPLTPMAWMEYDPEMDIDNNHMPNLLVWNPIEYIHHYIVLRDGVEMAQTTETSYPATVPGEYQVIGVSSDGIQSFASQPRNNSWRTFVNLPDEDASGLFSPELAYAPAASVTGYRGNGFREIDHNTEPIKVTVDIPQTGTYSLALRYANGNGPVNTENKCAIRTIAVDGQRTGIIVMPHRGVANWNDWSLTNTLQIHLTRGQHTITIYYAPENENMNLGTNHALVDGVILTCIK